MIRINLFPLFIANFAPTNPPKALQIAIGNAIFHIICPFIRNKQIEPKLVARFINLAFVLAFRKSIPNNVINPKIKNVPVPGPINPS